MYRTDVYQKYKLTKDAFTDRPPKSWEGKICWFTNKLPSRSTTKILPKRLGILWEVDAYGYCWHKVLRFYSSYIGSESYRYCALYEDDGSNKKSLLF